MKTGQKWFLGFGIGCGFLILLVLALASLGLSYFRDFVEDIEGSEQMQASLDGQLGDLDAYVPPPDGAVPPDRLEVFLQVREQMRPWHEAMTSHFEDFPPADEGPVSLGPMRQARIAFEVAGFFIDLGKFMQVRNETLLQHGMGVGEYFYIHTLVYHWWLGHDPVDGPERLYGLQHEAGVNIRFFDDETTFGESGSWRRYRRKARAMLERQLAALDADFEAAPPGYRDALAAEIASLDSDDARVPWAGALPAHVTAGLEGSRDLLEDSYYPVTNLFDMHDKNDGAR